MPTSIFSSPAAIPAPGHAPPPLTGGSGPPTWLSWIALAWYIQTWISVTTGSTRLRLLLRRPQPPPRHDLDSKLPYVTILRPIKGTDPNLELCLASTCQQKYPRDKYELVFCVASDTDSAIPVIKRVIEKHPGINVRLDISEENVGPNPKIRNLSKAYRDAVGDIVWILDCNVWVAPLTLRHSVDQLEGRDGRRGFKLVHHLPVAVDITNTDAYGRHSSDIARKHGSGSPLLQNGPNVAGKGWLNSVLSYAGGRLEENFLANSHAKFYTAVNTLELASCVVGKSQMFRRSHLAEVTRDGGERAGLLYFADYICEDHMISGKLWSKKLEEQKSGARKWRRHGMGTDLAIQPVQDMSFRDFTARRIRWISVRKYTELLPTLLEPNTESYIVALYGAYATTTIPFFSKFIGTSWTSFWLFVLGHLIVWCTVDRLLYNFLLSFKFMVPDENTPEFIHRGGRSFFPWFLQWAGRELLVPHITFWSLIPGPIPWRGGLYKIRWSDKKVEEINTKNVSS